MDPLSHSLPFQLKKRLAGAGLSEDYPNGLKTTDNIGIDDLGRVTYAELNYPVGPLTLLTGFNDAGLLKSLTKGAFKHDYLYDEVLRPAGSALSFGATVITPSLLAYNSMD